MSLKNVWWTWFHDVWPQRESQARTGIVLGLVDGSREGGALSLAGKRCSKLRPKRLLRVESVMDG